MKNIANLFFEAQMLQNVRRTGYHFLGAGEESVAEHSFMTTFIAYVISEMVPEVDARKIITMCLVHDLPEARIGDLNAVHKRYVKVEESKAVFHMTRNIPFGHDVAQLIEEFNAGETLEAKLANDADQLSFILELKALADIGHHSPETWLPALLKRLKTDTGVKIADAILNTRWDEWWRKELY